MKSLSLVLVSFALIAGCAAAPAERDAASESALVTPPDAAAPIELVSIDDPAALPAKVDALLAAFQNDDDLDIGRGIESDARSISGTDAGVTRSVTCTRDRMEIVSPGGTGFTQRVFTTCSLQGFDATRAGGSLPNVVFGDLAAAPLAGKLAELLARGWARGDLGVTKTGGAAPPCCDIPTSTRYELSDGASSLACVRRVGGFAPIQTAQCTFSRAIRPNE